MTSRLFLVAFLTGLAAPAMAASVANLATTIVPPSATWVEDVGRYQVRVQNIGNRTANSTVLTINLPSTHTSPTVYVLGTLGSYDSRCSRSGRTLTCALGGLGQNKSTLVWFDIALPYSASPIVFTASATTTSAETSMANNSDSETAALLYDAVAVRDGDLAVHDHCTGTALTSYFECELFPSSISSHETIFYAGGTLTFADAPAHYTGTWYQPAANRLHFEYLEDGLLVATFNGYGTMADCFEGVTTFPLSTYVSPYSVCLQ